MAEIGWGVPVNMLDQIHKCFRCGQLWSLWPACSQNLARLCNIYIYLIWLSHPIWLCSFKEGLDHIVQTQPESNLDGLVRFRTNGSGLEANWCARIISLSSGKTQPACYGFPTFRLDFILAQTVPVILCKTRPDWMWFWLTWPNGSSLDASQCARIIRPASGQCYQASLDQMQMGCGLFTGMLEPKVLSGLSRVTASLACASSIFFIALSADCISSICAHTTCQEFQNTLNFREKKITMVSPCSHNCSCSCSWLPHNAFETKISDELFLSMQV